MAKQHQDDPAFAARVESMWRRAACLAAAVGNRLPPRPPTALGRANVLRALIARRALPGWYFADHLECVAVRLCCPAHEEMVRLESGQATAAPIGSAERVEVYAARFAAGERLHIEGDWLEAGQATRPSRANNVPMAARQIAPRCRLPRRKGGGIGNF